MVLPTILADLGCFPTASGPIWEVEKYKHQREEKFTD